VPRVSGWCLAALVVALFVGVLVLQNWAPIGAGEIALLMLLMIAPTLRWAATVRRVPRRLLRPRGPRSGITLLSALLSLTALAITSAIALQMVATALRVRERQAAQVAALAIASSVLEQAQIGLVYAPANLGAVASTMTLSKVPGPVKGTTTLTATVRLPEGGAVDLSTIVPGSGPSASGDRVPQGGARR